MDINVEMKEKAEALAAKRAATEAARPDQRTKTNGLSSDGEAAGYALAESAIGLVKNQARELVNVVARLAEGSVDTRACFMKYLGKHQREMNAHVKEQEGTPDHSIYRKSSASARTRLSELTTIAKALNGGYVLEIRRDDSTNHPLVSAGGHWIPVLNFHHIVAEARVFLNSDAAGRGRPATPFLDKLKALCAKETEGKPLDVANKVWQDVAKFAEMGIKVTSGKATKQDALM